jgi:hypothetical protein
MIHQTISMHRQTYSVHLEYFQFIETSEAIGSSSRDLVTNKAMACGRGVQEIKKKALPLDKRQRRPDTAKAVVPSKAMNRAFNSEAFEAALRTEPKNALWIKWLKMEPDVCHSVIEQLADQYGPLIVEAMKPANHTGFSWELSDNLMFSVVRIRSDESVFLNIEKRLDTWSRSIRLCDYVANLLHSGMLIRTRHR